MFEKMKFKSLQKKAKKLHDTREAGVKVEPKSEIAIQLELAKIYDKNPYNKNYPQAELHALECYRYAASLGDINSQYICGQCLFDKARFWEIWSTGMYGHPIHKKYATQYYDEALAYLKDAEANGHPLAKRSHGLALINGWGVGKDVDGGFKLVLESIDQEKAWDRATKIFEELGLNKPEFFSMLMTQRPDKKMR